MPRKNHLVKDYRMIYTISCGACDFEFKEHGEGYLTHAYPRDLEEGEELECPECSALLLVAFSKE